VTDRRLAPVPRISRRRALRDSVLTSVVAATLILGGLWLQMSLGRDPSLGPKLAAAKSKRPAATAPAQSAASTVPSSDEEDGIEPESVPSPTVTVAPAPTPAPAQQLTPVQTSTS
jgi:hypothetical protein